MGDGEDPESRPRRLEAESRETPTMATLEDGSPAELAPHRWWAEGEQRGCQTTAVEEAGKGGHLKASRLPGLTSGSRANTGGRSGGAGSGGRLWGAGTGAFRPSLWHNLRAILSSPSATVQGAELLSAFTPSVGFLLQGRRCCRLMHLD